MSKKQQRAKDPEKNFSITSATIDDIEWIAQLEDDVYTKENAISEDILKEWHITNPRGFFVIKDRNNQRIGHLDILPIRPEILELFLKGAIVERQIHGEALYSPEEKEKVRSLYIESLAVRLSGRCKAAALSSLLVHLPSLLGDVCSLNNLRQIYAIAATKSGDRLMKNLGFRIVKGRETRKDGHDLFAVEEDVFLNNIHTICERNLSGRI